MDQHLETIDAFMDGERVNSDALRAALATDEGRGYLVELAAMREVVAVPAAAAASPAIAASPTIATSSTLATSVSGPGRSSSVSASLLLVAAALVAVVGTAGFALGTRQSARRDSAQAEAAPQPTRVLKLEAGVNWSEGQPTKGGN